MFRDILHSRLRLLLVPFLFSWTVSTFAQVQQTKSTIVFSGKIANSSPNQKIQLKFYENFLTFAEINYAAPIEADGSFQISIPYRENTSGFIAYGEIHVPIFVEKEDSIYVKTNAYSFIDSLEYSGRGGLRNNYLKASFLKFDVHDAKTIESGISQSTAENYQVLLSNYKAEKVAFLDEFLTKRDTHFSTPFYEYIKADINYWWGQNLMRYRKENPSSRVFKVPLSLEEDYYKFMDTLDLNNEAALNNANYLNYVGQYTDWREDMIAKGKLKFKNVEGTKQELVKIKKQRTYGQVLIEKLEVRKEAYDGLSIIAKLERGTEVLFLQDVTNDRFTYPYNGKRYRDKFLKIELSDGREGWVFNGGIHLKQKVVFVKKWVDIPDTRPELMQNFKYANFKGKVMRYAIARDLYKEITETGIKDVTQLEAYLNDAKDDPYTNVLRRVYMDIKNGVKPKVIKKDTSNYLTTLAAGIEGENKEIETILQKLTLGVIKNLNIKRIVKEKELAEEKVKIEAEEMIISAPDFSTFSRITTIDATTSSKTLNKAELVINTNPLLREETVFPFSKRSNANFNLNVSLKSSTTASLKLGAQTINLYLQPGYNLAATIKGNDLYTGLVFHGKGSDINNYFVAIANRFKHIDIELERKIRYAEPQEFKSFLNQVKTNKLQFLRDYLGTHTLSAEVVKYAKGEIEYWYAFNLMNYPYEHPIFHNQTSPMEVPDDYYDFIGEVALNNASALPNKFYLYYIQDYLSFVAAIGENKGLNRFELADKYLKGKPLFFYKALQHSIALKRDNDPGVEAAAYHFIKNCPYKLYGEFVKLAYQESRGIVEGTEAPEFELADVDGNIVSLSDYKGKVIYLDFWATWCRPCTRLLPAHQKLQKQFKDDNVAFVYVSMDRNANKWRDYLANGSFPGKHLFANKKMVKKYNVESLPYSVLIDADGKIVWQHTGGFSVQRTAQRILELLQ